MTVSICKLTEYTSFTSTDGRKFYLFRQSSDGKEQFYLSLQKKIVKL